MTNPQSILALDVATATGCCDGFVGEVPRLWSWYLADAGGSRPARLAMLDAFLVKYFESQTCDGVVYEAPMPIGMIANKKDGRVMMSEANVAFARGAIGVVECACYRAGKPVEGLAVMDARQSVLGWRTNRDKNIKTKERVQQAVAMLLPKDRQAQSDNEADAYVLWQFACNRLNPRLAVMQTPLFREATP